MVESGKKFIEKEIMQGEGNIFQKQMNIVRETAQQRAQDLESVPEATQPTQSTVGKVADTIVNSNVGQKLVGATNAIGEIPEKIEKKVAPYVAKQTAKIAQATVKADINKAEKEKLLAEDVYEDTAKVEKVAGIDEEGQQYIKSQARKEYEAMQTLSKLDIGVNKLKDTFPEYWETQDGKRVFRTDGQYIVDRPVGYTDDLLGTMQNAYNDVTYAYAQNGTVLTPDDLKKAYPEYKNVSDGTLANFISGCLYDVQRGQRSEVSEIADFMGSMAMSEGYTNRMDGYLDVLSDETFTRWGMISKMGKNKKGEIDMINAGAILKQIADYIREAGEFVEGQSDWAILSSYRNMDNEISKEIDKYMKVLEEQDSHDGIEAFVAEMYENYMGNVGGAKTDLADKDFKLRDTQRIAVQEVMAEYRDDIAKLVEQARTISEDETWYPMKNFIEYTMTGKYVRDNKGNYYITGPLRKQQLAYSRQEDGTYLDAEGHLYSEEQVRGMTAGGIVNGMAGALTSIADKGAEAFVDASRIGTAYEQGGLKATTQYDFALAGDILNAAFGVQMVNPLVQLLLNAPIVGPVSTAGMEAVMDNLGPLFLSMLEEIGVAQGWTTESKEKTEEALGVLGLMGTMKTLKVGKDQIKKSPRIMATKKAIDSFVKKLTKALKIRDKKGIESMIEQKMLELEQEKEQRQMNRIEQQQGQPTGLKEDVRAGEKSDKIIEKEQEQKKKDLAEKGEEALNRAEIPLFSLLGTEFQKAKREFFEEFYEEYKKLAGGEEFMDNDVVFQKALNDMEGEPEKKAQLLEKYNELFLREELERNMEERMQFGEEINALRQQVLDGLKPKETPITTKDIQEPKTTEEAEKAGRKPTKGYRKAEKEQLTNLTEKSKIAIRSNKYRYILKDIINEIMIPEIKKRLLGKDKIKSYNVRDKESQSIVSVQEKIIELWKNKVQAILDKLMQKKDDIFDFKKKFFRTTENMDIKSFFTEFLKETKLDNILSRLFKTGEITIEEVFDENGESHLEVQYNGEAQVPSGQVQEAMFVLQKFLEEAEKGMQDGKMLHNELSLYNLRSVLKNKGWKGNGDKKSGELPIASQDLYAIFNDFLDTYKDITGVGRDIRAYDAAFQTFFDAMDIFEKLFNKDGEIRKESRNRIINIRRKNKAVIDMMDKLIPGTKEILDMVEAGPNIITEMVKLMEKTEYRTWMSKRVFKYGPMALTFWVAQRLGANAATSLLASMFMVPLGETIGERFQKKFGKKVPLKKEIEEVMKQLELTPEEEQIVKEQRPKDFEKTLEDIDKLFDEKLAQLDEGEFERGNRKGPKVYDKDGNEIVWVDDTKGGPDDTTPPSGGNGGGNGGGGDGGNKPEGGDEGKITPDDIAGKGEGEIIDMLLQKTEEKAKVLADFMEELGAFVDESATPEEKKNAQYVQAAVGSKIVSTVVDMSPDTKKKQAAKKKADYAVSHNDWNSLVQLIHKSTGVERAVYTKALYNMMINQKAPMNLLKLTREDLYYLSDADLGGIYGEDVGLQKKDTKYEKARARVKYKDIQDEVSTRKVDSGNSDYDVVVRKGAQVSEILRNQGKGNNINESNLGEGAGKEYEAQTKGETYAETDAGDERYQEDVERERTSTKHSEKHTERELKKQLRVLNKEGEIIDKEMEGTPSIEAIEARDNLWFSFEKFGNRGTEKKDRMRYNDKGYKITNHNKKDYIDGGLDGGTAEIEWGQPEITVDGSYKDAPTRIYVNTLEIFDKMPELEKNLPENTEVIDLSTQTIYDLGDIKKMDVRGETNKKNVEKYYEELYNSYPEEVKDMFSEEYEEKSQVQPSSKGKSEAKKSQAEQSTTKSKKTSKSKEKKSSNPEDIEEYFKPEKSKDFKSDMSEWTEEELHDAMSWKVTAEDYVKIGEELLKRFEARYDSLTLNEIRQEIEMADMFYGKDVKKKFKDLLKRKEKDEIDHLFGEDRPVDWKKVGNMSRMKPENLLKEPDSKEKFHAMEKQMLKLGNQYLSNGTSSFTKKYKAKYNELKGKYRQTPKEEFDEMYDEAPVEELNIPRDKIDDLIGQIEKRTGANMEVEFSMDKDNKLMAIIRRRPKEGIIGQDWYSRFIYDLGGGNDKIQAKVRYEMKRIEDEINGIILPF